MCGDARSRVAHIRASTTLACDAFRGKLKADALTTIGLLGFDQGGDNPYRALLACADRFVVTSDSLSMMAEVARLGHTLAIFTLSPSRWRLGAWLRRPRNLDALPALLFARGLAVPLGEPFQPPAGPPPDELAEVAARIRALVAPPG